MCLAKMASRFFPRMEIIPPSDPNHMSSDPNQVGIPNIGKFLELLTLPV